MLRILVSPPGRASTHIEWNLSSTQRPLHPYVYKASLGELVIIADGAELDWIRFHFTGIPMIKEATQLRWSGDIAAFIVNNIPCTTGPYSL